MADEKSVIAVIRAARPTFRNGHDKVAFAVHATLLASGYVLTAAGAAAASDDALSSTGSDEVGIENWNEAEDEYAFLYANPDKGGEKVLVKCLAMDDQLMIDALAHGAYEPVHCEIDVRECVEEGVGGNYAAQYKNLDKLVKTLNESIIRKLDGSTVASSAAKSGPSQEAKNGSGFLTEGATARPVGPQIHPSGVVVPPINPARGGDLFPGPGAGMYPTSGRFDGDMLVGPNDPRWGGSLIGPSFPGGLPGVPPGARFDPYGPPGVPGFEPNRFARDPRRPGGRPHPDLEHFGPDSDFI